MSSPTGPQEQQQQQQQEDSKLLVSTLPWMTAATNAAHVVVQDAPFTNLPVEIIWKIASYASVGSLIPLSETCLHFDYLLDDEELWKELFVSRWGSEFQINEETSFSPTVLQLFSSTSAFFFNAIESSFLLGGIRSPQQSPRFGPVIKSPTSLSPLSSLPSLSLSGSRSPSSVGSKGGSGFGFGSLSLSPTSSAQQQHKKIDPMYPPVSGASSRRMRRTRHTRRKNSFHGFSLSPSSGGGDGNDDDGNADGDGDGGDASHRQWRIACTIRHRQGQHADNMKLRKCSICNELDVFTTYMETHEKEQSSELHSSTNWMRPCRCDIWAHRGCVENQILQQEAQRIVERRNNEQNPQQQGGGGGGGAGGVVHNCETCGTAYRTSKRLPITFVELLSSTWEDRYRLLHMFGTISIPLILAMLFIVVGIENYRYIHNRLMLLLPLVETRGAGAASSTVAMAGAALGAQSSNDIFTTLYPEQDMGFILPTWRMCLFCIIHHGLLFILFSEKLSDAVSRIWSTTLFWFYVKLYSGVTVSVVIFLFINIRAPAPIYEDSTFLAVWQDWCLRGPYAAWFLVVSWMCTVFYFGTAISIQFLFWKTSYRVDTLRDSRPIQRPAHPRLHTLRTQCVNCRLGLCPLEH